MIRFLLEPFSAMLWRVENNSIAEKLEFTPGRGTPGSSR